LNSIAPRSLIAVILPVLFLVKSAQRYLVLLLSPSASLIYQGGDWLLAWTRNGGLSEIRKPRDDMLCPVPSGLEGLLRFGLQGK
jgi:hypothetical protein